MSNYAKLGYGCMTNMDILVSNAKFFPLKNAIYEKPYWDKAWDKKQREQVENLQGVKQENKQENKPGNTSGNCCGR